MAEEMDFFIFLLERYARRVGEGAGEVLRRWDDLGVTSEIYDGYFQYHQEALENAYEDIDSLVATGRHAFA